MPFLCALCDVNAPYLGEMKKIVLTTGANSGIGLATAVELARRGWQSVGSVRSKAKAEPLLEAAREAGADVGVVVFDVTDAEGCERAVAEVVERHGAIDALVNNAGYGLAKAVEDTTDEEARQILETMVVAPARLARLVLPHMRNRAGGRIVNVSSIYGRTTTPLSGWYQASKHALEGLSDALRMEVASDGVQVVLVEPGGLRTDIWDDFDENTAGQAGSRYETAYQRARQTISLSTPLMGKPANCARVIAHALRHAPPDPLPGRAGRLHAGDDPGGTHRR